MGYQQRRRKAKKKYRYSDNGKKTRIEAERRRRLRIPSGKNKRDKGIRKKKQLLSAKQNNPATISANKVNRTKTSKRGKKNHGKKKSTKGDKEACHLCGAEGMIVKRISWNDGKAYPYFSFRIKRRETSDTNIGKDKRFISRGIRLYWQKE